MHIAACTLEMSCSAQLSKGASDAVTMPRHQMPKPCDSTSQPALHFLQWHAQSPSFEIFWVSHIWSTIGQLYESRSILIDSKQMSN
eukprot:gnl/TRDRNA2_/TRDRNA2_141145_c1_seq1.p1 gnl/TRDRNA2_/TRDRNA2_141145_c1~~gnl/TRDRNA2_/TRDRNA2_141145_c1_seq1.p1  ORF type:complete len:101 (+),score=4.37 gnl/TRDRNA2_/TRDRNA2_141145_c1_seq1:47-304(+)